MEKTQENIRHDMAIAYFNTLRTREAELIKSIQTVREELTICAKALDDYEAAKEVPVEQPATPAKSRK
jgi:hypothetical protein